MTDFEKMMKDMAEKAMNNAEGFKVEVNDSELTNEEIAGAVMNLLGGLFSNAVCFMEELDKEEGKQPVKEKPVKEKPVKQEKGATPKKETVKVDKKAMPLSKKLANIKEHRGSLGLDMLNKDTLTELLAVEKLSVEDVAKLFGVSVELVEYAVMTHKVTIPKEKDLLEENLIHVFGLNHSQLSDYFHSRIDSLEAVNDPRLKALLTKQFVKGLADVGYNLGMTISDNQLMLVKRDEHFIYVNVYNLTVEEFLKNYDLLKIDWKAN